MRKKETRWVSMRKREWKNEKSQTGKNFIKHEINLPVEERKFLKGMRRGSLADVRFAFHFTLKFMKYSNYFKLILFLFFIANVSIISDYNGFTDDKN